MLKSSDGNTLLSMLLRCMKQYLPLITWNHLIFYHFCLQYMEELLKQGEFLEFFIEGQRTRSGKAVYPKGGLLSVVVDSLMNGKHFLFRV